MRGDPLLELAADAVFTLLGVMGYGAALYLGWRIVGGRAALQKFLTIHFYFAGILDLLKTAIYLGMMGTIRAFDPALYKEIYEAVFSGSFMGFTIKNSERMMATPGIWVTIVGYVAILLWIYAGWGAYRELNRLSRMRSFAAGLLFLLLCVPVTALLFLWPTRSSSKQISASGAEIGRASCRERVCT